jgi:hypothetical protein
MEGSVDDLPLAAAFARGLDVFTRMQSGHADADSLASGAAAMRHAVTRLDVEGVFSRNESKDDLPTENLRYLLAPWYLAELVSRAPTKDPAARSLALVEITEMYERFLTRCEQHDMLSESATLARSRRDGESLDPATARDEKVARFKRERAIRQRLTELDEARIDRTRRALAELDWDDANPENDPSVSAAKNEPEERERWTLLVEDAVGKTIDSMRFVSDERELLALRASRADNQGDGSSESFPGDPERLDGRSSGRSRPPRRIDGSGVGNYVIGPGGTIEPIGAGYAPSEAEQIRDAVASFGSSGFPSLTANLDRRHVLAHQVFRPSHVLPTMTVEQAGELEYAELAQRTAREAENRARREREESALTEDEKDARELRKQREWDAFKDDNPFGHGNSKLRPCS